MRDLTTGPVGRHLFGMAVFIGIGLSVQTLYLLVDLYFVSHLGKAAIAGVSSAGSIMFLVMAASPLVSVGSLSLISQAIGRKDDEDAQLVFEQGLSLSLILALTVLVLGYTVGIAGVGTLGADRSTSAMGQTYLSTFLPSLAMMFPLAAIGSALRASGVTGPPMLIQSLTVILNAILAPVLIVGWLTGHPLGVAGAGLASSIATLAGVIVLFFLFGRMQQRLRLNLAKIKPRFQIWRRIMKIGLPATGEFLIMFVMSGVVYLVISDFGPQAQAGFGIASRVMQAIFLPAMAIASAAAPIAGQNFGANHFDRVRATFRVTVITGAVIMFALTILCQINPHSFVILFIQDSDVVIVAIDYLRISSWNFVAIGIVFACSGMFQALGNTRPALVSSAVRMAIFVIPAVYLSTRNDVALHDFWYLSVVSVTVQAIVSLSLLRLDMRKKHIVVPQPIATIAV